MTGTVAAAVVLGWAVRGRRSAGARCPACGYDMAAIAGTRCPECGREAPSRQALTHRRRRPVLAVGAALAMLAFAGLLARAAWLRGWHYAVLPTWQTISRETADDLVIETLERRDPNSPQLGRILRISRHGRVMLAMEGFYFEPGVRLWKDGRPTDSRELLRDLTGDGRPELVVTASSGGSGGESTSFVLTLDPPDHPSGTGLETIGVLPFPGRFEDLDGDGAAEFVCGDNTYRYRWTSGAESPQPLVVLRWDGKRFVADVDAMRRVADPVAGSTATGPRTAASVLRKALGLIYQGRGDAGLGELRSAAMGDDATIAGTARQVVEELPAALRESPFRQELEFLNADQPEFRAWMRGGR